MVSDGRQVSSFADLFWIRVPQLYRCQGSSVKWACGQHLLPGSEGGYVPCWVSRPWEKTIMLRYMNTLSMVCAFLAVFELIHIFWNMYQHSNKDKSPEVEETTPKAPLNNYVDSVASTSDQAYLLPAKEPSPSPPPVDKTDGQLSLQLKKRSPILAHLPEGSESDESAKLLKRRYRSEAVLRDIASGDLPLETVRAALKQYKKQGVPTTTSKYQTLPNRKYAGGIRKRRTPSFTAAVSSYGDGTQSLNRPKKVIRPNYGSLFRLQSVDFSVSEEDGSDYSAGGSSSTLSQRLSPCEDLV